MPNTNAKQFQMVLHFSNGDETYGRVADERTCVRECAEYNGIAEANGWTCWAGYEVFVPNKFLS